jgi:hypothetical protein
MAHVASYDSSPTLTHNCEYEGGTFLRNVGNELPNHTAQQPKRPGYSTITSNSQNTSGIKYRFRLSFADKELYVTAFTFSFSTTTTTTPTTTYLDKAG